LRNEPLAKKELASFHSKICKDEAEARRMIGDGVYFLYLISFFQFFPLLLFVFFFVFFCFSCYNCLFVIQFLLSLLFLGSWQSLIVRIIEIAFSLLFFFIPT
jgi:hypothetical protein